MAFCALSSGPFVAASLFFLIEVQHARASGSRVERKSIACTRTAHCCVGRRSNVCICLYNKLLKCLSITALEIFLLQLVKLRDTSYVGRINY